MRERTYSAVKAGVVILIALLALPLQCAPFVSTDDGAWEWVYPTPHGNWHRGAWFVDSSTGWQFGDDGEILKTTNGGQTWAPQRSGTSKNLYAACFTDASTGWIAADDGILKTTDGGATWRRQASPWRPQWYQDTGPRYRICSTDPQHVWATGSYWIEDDTSTEFYGAIVHTSDGGAHWTIHKLPGFWDIYSISFRDSLNGWAAAYYGDDAGTCYRVLLQTTNGGDTWIEHKTPLDDPNSMGGFCAVQFIDSNVGYGAGNTVCRTADGGATWQPLDTGGVASFAALYFLNQQIGWATGWRGEIIKTTDGGATWTLQRQADDQSITAIHFIDADNGWAEGDVVYRTSDGGNTWAPLNPYTLDAMTCMSFLDRNAGWIAGYDGAIRKTTDGGATWMPQTSAVPMQIQAIQFADSLHGWAGGKNGLMRTVDGGENWTAISLPSTDDEVASISFVDASCGWAAGGYYAAERGLLMRSADGGVTWTQQSVGVPGWIARVGFVDRNTGWAVVRSSNLYQIMKTTDGGVTWCSQRTTGRRILDVCFLDPDTGWALEPGTEYYVPGCRVVRTTDGGQTWTVTEVKWFPWHPSSIRFADARHGWLGDRWNVYATSDGGVTWQPTTRTSNHRNFLNLHCIDANTCWVIGSDGEHSEPTALLRTTTAGLPGCGWAKQQPDGKQVDFGHLVVTGVFDGFVYVEHPSRQAGLRINTTGADLRIGDFVRVGGVVRTSDGEKVIDASSVEVITRGWGELSPMSMQNTSVGKSTCGLLVQTWGRSRYVDEHTFTIDDGSGAEVRCIVPEGVTVNPAWSFATVTGVSSCETAASRVLRVRTAQDIQAY